ncbi:MAG: hypothetical protein LBB21_05055 [Holosporaceae bacterium]|nr:hypothetical protein [Holosporaceae bacterium]
MDRIKNQRVYSALFCFIFVGCNNRTTGRVCPVADQHVEKLRRHFIGEIVGDISTLISETRVISATLKQSGMSQQANRFDSYIDVLTYGNRTIDESLNDVMELVKYKQNSVCKKKSKMRWF